MYHFRLIQRFQKLLTSACPTQKKHFALFLQSLLLYFFSPHFYLSLTMAVPETPKTSDDFYPDPYFIAYPPDPSRFQGIKSIVFAQLDEGDLQSFTVCICHADLLDIL